MAEERERLRATRVKSDEAIVKDVIAASGGGKKPSRQSFAPEERPSRPQVSCRVLRMGAAAGSGGGRRRRWRRGEVRGVHQTTGGTGGEGGGEDEQENPGGDYAAITTLRMEARESWRRCSRRRLGRRVVDEESRRRTRRVQPAHLEVGARKVNAESKAAIKAERKAAVREIAARGGRGGSAGHKEARR